ncbi:MAG: DNA repair protein RecN [Chitinophagia bacterium]|jgi:DNA repair protein RecN (Recombination protein N)
MLQHLHIQNYAIIEELTIRFSEKLNIITGETGAGKSILMGALGLILGDRADTQILLNREKKCSIEGIFIHPSEKNIQQFLENYDIENDGELILRREISSNGKSRAFINDTPVSLQQLRELAALLVDLHRQFDTLTLGETNFQREVVDALMQQPDLLAAYKKQFHTWSAQKKELDQLIQWEMQATKERDYQQYVLSELASLSLKPGELENLEQELLVLQNAGNIQQALSQIHYLLRESEQPLLPALKQSTQSLQSFIHLLPALQAIAERLQSTHIELSDIADEVEKLKDQYQVDEQRTDWIHQRLSEGYKLYKKHGVTSTDALLEVQEQLTNQLAADEKRTAQKIELEKSTEESFLQLQALATQLTTARKKVIAPLEMEVAKLLKRVGMQNATIQIQVTAQTPNEYGADQIEFLFDANQSGRWEPLKKVASGGELSRLMLCIKSLVANSMDMPTLIFDEIDTGISGEAAKQVGMIMKEMADNRQLICITHQPQIAGKAHAHYLVYKQSIGTSIRTGIRELNEDERVKAIASMLSGQEPTTAALANARELMD